MILRPEPINTEKDCPPVLHKPSGSKKTVRKKVDKIEYAKRVDTGVSDIQEEINCQNMDFETLELGICKQQTLLKKSAEETYQKKKYGKNKPTLKVWSNEIAIRLTYNSNAHKEWKKAGKPWNIDNPLLLAKKRTCQQ